MLHHSISSQNNTYQQGSHCLCLIVALFRFNLKELRTQISEKVLLIVHLFISRSTEKRTVYSPGLLKFIRIFLGEMADAVCPPEVDNDGTAADVAEPQLETATFGMS